MPGAGIEQHRRERRIGIRIDGLGNAGRVRGVPEVLDLTGGRRGALRLQRHCFFSLGPKRPPVAIYGKFRRGGIKGSPFYPRQVRGAASCSSDPPRFAPCERVGSRPTLHNRLLAAALATFRVVRSRLRGRMSGIRSRDTFVPEFCPRPRAKINSPPAIKEGAERREAHPTNAAQHRSASPLARCLGRGARRRQVYAICATHLLSGRARLPALCCGSRQGERIRRWLSSSSRVS